MKNIIPIIAFFLFSCCKYETNHDLKHKSEEVHHETLTKDINGVIEAIILQDSMQISEDSLLSNAICQELHKLTIEELPYKLKDSTIVPPPSGSIYLHELTSGTKFFSENDTKYLLEQNSLPNHLILNEGFIGKFRNISCTNRVRISGSEGISGYYKFSIPIFSSGRDNAYVQRDYHCGTLCGYGKSYYLKKIDGFWKIIKEYQTWIS